MREKKDYNHQLIISYLYQNNMWVEANKLAVFLNVTPRTIRNYIAEINQKYATDHQPIILSSQKGYKLNTRLFNTMNVLSRQLNQNDSSKREVLILNRLIQSKDPIDIFDLCEELYVSESTLGNELIKVKDILKEFHLSLQIHKYQLLLKGDEKDKRKLMNYLLLKEDYHFFNSLDTISAIFPDYDTKMLQDFVYQTCTANGLYLNDYSLQNILIHLIITIDRIRNDNLLNNEIEKETDYEPANSFMNHIALQCAFEIASYVQEIYSILFIPTEVSYLAIIISSNSSNLRLHSMNYADLKEFIDSTFIVLVEQILEKIVQYYYLKPFPEEFKLKFIIHVYNLYKRLQYNCTVINPMTNDIKSSYPLIFDISVLFCNELSKELHLTISQNEIAYIAYHFGAYFENQKKSSNKLRCVFISNSYYNLEYIQFEKLAGFFSDTLDFVDHFQISKVTYSLVSSLNVDLIITVCPLTIEFKVPVQIVHPIITEKDLRHLNIKIDELNIEKKRQILQTHILKFIDPSLFKVNFYKDDYLSLIEDLCQEAKIKGYIGDDFLVDVLNREKLYSTAFDDIVAIPHALSVNAKKSFFSIVINERKSKWGNSYVNIIILIGINEQDLASFREIFDWLVSILTEKKHYDVLIHSKNYTEFINNLISLADIS